MHFHGGISKDGETSGYSVPCLPEVSKVYCNLNFTETTLTIIQCILRDMNAWLVCECKQEQIPQQVFGFNKTEIVSLDNMQDIWRRIHSLMPMDAAARAACLSHAFLSSQRCYPNLTLTRKALCSKACGGNLSPRIDSILKKHSGIGLKILRLNLCRQYNSFCHI